MPLVSRTTGMDSSGPALPAGLASQAPPDVRAPEMGRYRILYLVRRVPYPLNSGTRIRQFQLLSAYSQIADVVLVCYYTDEAELAGLSALAPHCADILPVSFRSRHGDSGRSRLLRWWGQRRASVD